jgi:hypothetical protein
MVCRNYTHYTQLTNWIPKLWKSTCNKIQKHKNTQHWKDILDTNYLSWKGPPLEHCSDVHLWPLKLRFWISNSNVSNFEFQWSCSLKHNHLNKCLNKHSFKHKHPNKCSDKHSFKHICPHIYLDRYSFIHWCPHICSNNCSFKHKPTFRHVCSFRHKHPNRCSEIHSFVETNKCFCLNKILFRLLFVCSNFHLNSKLKPSNLQTL